MKHKGKQEKIEEKERNTANFKDIISEDNLSV